MTPKLHAHRLARDLGTLLFALLLAAPSAPAEPLPRGDRRIGFGFPAGDETPTGWWNFAIGKQAGMEYWVVGGHWSELVDKKGRPRLESLAGFDQTFCRAGLKLYLSLTPFDGAEPRMPRFFTRFDDPAMADAYVALVEQVLALFPSAEILGLLMGHEVERYFDGHPYDWAAYARFVERVVPRLRPLLPPDAFIGLSAGFQALTATNLREMRRINAHTTAVFTSYMPLGDLRTMSLEGPEKVHEDFQKLVDTYPDGTTAWRGKTRFAFAEIGYPATSRERFLNEAFLRDPRRCAGRREGCGELVQAVFVEEVFRAWDRHADRIKHLTFTLLHDPPAKFIKRVEHGISSGGVRYFEEIGLRRNAPKGLGTDKLGMKLFRDEVDRRNWVQSIEPPACHVHPRSTTGPDRTPLELDNCLLAANQAPHDCDSDGDGFGNACDCDFDQDFVCDRKRDGRIISEDIQAGRSGTPPLVTDMNCDGSVDADDFNDHFFFYLANVRQPGPSGLPDGDHDGVPDATDNCPKAMNATQIDRNANRIGDACDPSAPPPRTGCTTLRGGSASILLFPVWVGLRRSRGRAAPS